MSGSAALAAARRRRAAPQSPVPSSESTRRQTSSSNSVSIQDENNVVSPNTPPNRINPTQMLLNHNRLLENLNNIVNNLNSRVDDELISKTEILNMINESIETSFAKHKMHEDNVDFYKTKYNKMSTQLQEIKKHIIKVQTFAMETNLQCLELKKKIFREKSENKTMDQIMKSDKNKLEVSKESEQDQIKQIRNIGNITDVLHGTTNEIV
jgi:hypothetical protein